MAMGQFTQSSRVGNPTPSFRRVVDRPELRVGCASPRRVQLTSGVIAGTVAVAAWVHAPGRRGADRVPRQRVGVGTL
jgi:hypothetical protein